MTGPTSGAAAMRVAIGPEIAIAIVIEIKTALTAGVTEDQDLVELTGIGAHGPLVLRRRESRQKRGAMNS